MKSLVPKETGFDDKTGLGSLTISTDGGDITLNYIRTVDGYWIVYNVTYGGAIFTTDMHNPLGFSSSCSSNLTLRETSTGKTDFKPQFLQFPTFQLQFFNNGTNEKTVGFDDSYDCVGFTSPAIWSGLFVTVILAIIISIGIAMIMDIKTMDRFDDPKGKTIIINAVD